MKVIYVLILAFGLAVSPIYAQTVSTGFGESGTFQNDGQRTSKNQLELKYGSIGGSPYYMPNFVKSDIYFRDGKVKRGIFVRLNLFDNNLEFEQGFEYFILSKIQHVSKIVLSNEEIIYIENNDLTGFYKLLVDGENKFLSSLKVSFKNAVPTTNSYSEEKEATFKLEKEKYYLLLSNGSLIYIKNKKQFNSYFSINNEALVSYVKRNKLNPTKSSDLVVIVNFLNDPKKDTLQ